MRGRILWGLAAAVVLAVAGGLWAVLSPTWAVERLVAETQMQLGRALTVRNGAHLSFSPLSIRLDGVDLASAAGEEAPMVAAGSVTVPVSLGGLLGQQADFSTLNVADAEIALLIDARGQPNWSFAAVKQPSRLTITMDNGRLRYFDQRNGQAFAVSHVTGLLSVEADGLISFKGTVAIGGRLATIDAALKSLARVNEDGSPLDLALEAPELTATFGGRIATAKVLGLAGSVSIASPNIKEAIRWAGIPLDQAPDGYSSFSADGALETAGRAFAIRKAALGLGPLRAAGELVLDMRGEKPKMQAEISAPSLDLAPFLPKGGAKDGQWGRSNLGFALLRNFEADLNMDVQALRYDAIMDLPARIGAHVKDGKFEGGVALRTGGTGTATLSAAIDAKPASPVIGFEFKAENTDLGILAQALTGTQWLAGTGNATASLSGAGSTQEEIAGTLRGRVSLAARDGAVTGTDLKGLLSGVSQRILEGWQAAPGETRFANLTAEAGLSDGIASFSALTFDSTEVALSATGTMDFLRRAVDLKANARLASGSGTASLPVPVVAKGPWDAPRIYPDIEGILLNPAEGFAKLKSMGLPATEVPQAETPAPEAPDAQAPGPQLAPAN